MHVFKKMVLSQIIQRLTLKIKTIYLKKASNAKKINLRISILVIFTYFPHKNNMKIFIQIDWVIEKFHRK